MLQDYLFHIDDPMRDAELHSSNFHQCLLHQKAIKNALSYD